MADHFKQEFMMSGMPFNPDVNTSIGSIVFGSLLVVLIVYALIYVHYVHHPSGLIDLLIPARLRWNRMFTSPFVFARFDNTTSMVAPHGGNDDKGNISVGGVEFNEADDSRRYQRGATSFDNPLFKEAVGQSTAADEDDDDDGPKAGSSIEDISPHQFSEMIENIRVVDTANLVEVELDATKMKD